MEKKMLVGLTLVYDPSLQDAKEVFDNVLLALEVYNRWGMQIPLERTESYYLEIEEGDDATGKA